MILTGNGGNPFTEAGWTGWTALDNGYALTNSDPSTGDPSLTMAPCFQTGQFSATLNDSPVVGGTAGETSPTDFCGTASDAADTPIATPFTQRRRGDDELERQPRVPASRRRHTEPEGATGQAHGHGRRA